MTINKPIFKVGDKFSNRQNKRGIYIEIEITCIESVRSYPAEIFERWQITLLITHHEGMMWRQRCELLSQEDAKKKIEAIMSLKKQNNLY